MDRIELFYWLLRNPSRSALLLDSSTPFLPEYILLNQLVASTSNSSTSFSCGGSTPDADGIGTPVKGSAMIERVV